MSRDREEFQPGNGTGLRGQWQQRAEVFVFFVVFLLVSWPIIMTYKPPWRQPAQSSLVHGATMYALVVVAVLLLRVVARLSLRPLKLVLASLLVALLMSPPILGSADIVYGLIQLAGSRVDNAFAVLLVLLLYILAFIPVALFFHRAGMLQ